MITEKSQIDYEIAEFSREAESKRLSNTFADFLALNEISGQLQAPAQSSLLSAEHVIDRHTTVEVVSDQSGKSDLDQTPLTVLAHRDKNNDIKSIEVMCSCGKHAVIAIDYDESPDEGHGRASY